MQAPSLEARIAFLSAPANYLERTLDVDAIETHMSWIFLTDRFAYKLKKPVANDYLDFSTLEARRFYCEEEFRLNRRLAASVYLGVLPLTVDAKGYIEFAGEGQVIDWLVLMRRLPAELAMDYCIQHQHIPYRAIENLGERLAHFYRHCREIPMTPEQYRTRFTRNLEAIMENLAAPEYELSVDGLMAIASPMRVFLQQRAALFDGRVRDWRIIEGHGDLRAEHIYLEPEPVIVDCLEFSRDLRTVDAAYDLSFLALECERLDAPETGKQLLDIYAGIAGDIPPPELIHYYQAYHACSRARIALWHLKEAPYRDSPKWPIRAREWLRLALLHVKFLD